MDKIVTRPLKAFLCHASGDKPPVRGLYKRLVFEGVDAWLDKEKLLPGQDWRVEIPRAVKEADVVIIFLSEKSISKEGYIQKEIKFALDSAEEKPEGTIFLIPARLEECVVPERLSRWQWVDLYEENGFIQLLRSLKLRADAVGATVVPASYEESDKEIEHRVDQLYTEGLAAFYTEDWDKACQRFQTILSEYPNHKRASEKIAEAEKQRSLAKSYAQAMQGYKAENWAAAIRALEELSQKSTEYKDAGQLLKNARKQKQINDLYAEAKTLHNAQKYHAVLKVFEQIFSIEPDHPDADNLLPSAQKEVAELKRLAELNDQYSQAVREMDAGQWVEARALLEHVHKSQTGFLETERLLRKVEDEITKAEEHNKRNDQVNMLYEQAHGLIRSKNWRKALDKMEEIQKMEDQFLDKDNISEKAKTELAREEQEAQRQNELAAMYSESARLLKDGKYQEALDKWREVKAVDPKYPDRQWVQRTAKKKLTETAKPAQVKPRFVMKYSPWIGVVAIVIVAGVIAGVILSGKGNQSVWSAITKVPNKTSAPHSATSVPETSGYADPTIYDDFDNTAYDGRYNMSLWDAGASSNNYVISQDKGKLTITVKDVGSAGFNSYKSSRIIEPTFFEMRAYLDPSTTDIESHLYMGIETDEGYTVCGVFGYGNTENVSCWSNYYGKMAESSLGLDDISPSWHVFRFEIEPETMTISYVIDGKQVGHFVPRESMPEHYNDLKNKSFTFRLALNHTGTSKAPIGCIDYVRMGAIEDDPASK